MTLLVDGRSAIFERGDFTYLVSSVAPFEPGANELDEFSFAESLRKIAPNEHILWMRGTYVEGGKANENGQEWQADDIAIKSLTPVFMPVTVMHDPRTAVGLIADTVLEPGTEKSAARIDNTLAVWKHRFPEVAEEISANYAAGTMMQSQECRPAYYDCGECGARFPKLPRSAERANWCSHLLAGEVSMGVTKSRRIFGNVTFTGTGLIFGTRGARGALSSAKLDVLEDEVAEFHAAANRDSARRLSSKPAATRRTPKVDIEQKDYEALVAKAAKADELAGRITELETSAAQVPTLTKTVEELEISKKKADDDLAAANVKIGTFEEQSRAATLATDRKGKLGKGFLAKLPESVKTRLDDQSRKLSDEDWSARLEELSEMAGGVKPDDPGEESSKDEGDKGKGGTFTAEETSRTTAGNGGSGNGSGGEPSRAAVGAVVGGLLQRVAPPRQSAKEPAAK